MAMIPNRSGPRPFPDSYLDRLYSIPRSTVSMEDHLRLHHRDLQALDDLELQRERRCVLRRFDYDPDTFRRSWLMDRITAIDRECSARRDWTRQPERPVHQGHPAPKRVTVAGMSIDLPVSGGRPGYE